MPLFSANYHTVWMLDRFYCWADDTGGLSEKVRWSNEYYGSESCTGCVIKRTINNIINTWVFTWGTWKFKHVYLYNPKLRKGPMKKACKFHHDAAFQKSGLNEQKIYRLIINLVIW